MKKPLSSSILLLSFTLLAPGRLAESAPPAAAEKAPVKEKTSAVKRREAVLAWAESRSPMNAPSLLEALGDKDAMVREFAIQGLKDLNWTPASIPIGQMLLTDSAFQVREGAAQALRTFKDVTQVSTLLTCASADKHPAVRVTCLESVADFPGPGVTKAFIAASKDPFPEVRRTAMVLLGRSNDPSAMPTVLAALKDPDAAVRANAAQDIGTFARMNQPSELKKLLVDPDPRVQASAARSLLVSGDVSGLDVAMKMARSTDQSVRLVAVDALGYSLDTSAQVLLAEMASKDPDITIQQSAKLSLDRIAQRKAK